MGTASERGWDPSCQMFAKLYRAEGSLGGQETTLVLESSVDMVTSRSRTPRTIPVSRFQSHQLSRAIETSRTPPRALLSEHPWLWGLITRMRGAWVLVWKRGPGNCRDWLLGLP